jgi:hypothetical protein
LRRKRTAPAAVEDAVEAVDVARPRRPRLLLANDRRRVGGVAQHEEVELPAARSAASDGSIARSPAKTRSTGSLQIGMHDRGRLAATSAASAAVRRRA